MLFRMEETALAAMKIDLTTKYYSFLVMFRMKKMIFEDCLGFLNDVFCRIISCWKKLKEEEKSKL